MKLLPKDKLFILVMLLLITFLSIGLYYSYRWRVGKTNYESVGVVRYKYHVVLRKYADRMVWEEVEPQTPVYPFDAILTKDKSDAEIDLKNGLKISMDANTMIVIDMLENELGVVLQSGSLLTESTTSNGFLVTEDGSLIRLDKASARISANQEGLQLDVKTGKVNFTNPQGKLLEVKKGETLLFNKKTGGHNIVRPPIQLGNPNDGSLFATNKAQTEVTFEWQSEEKTKEETLVLSEDPTLNKAKKIKVTGKTSHREKLPHGSYYWQIQAKSQDQKTISSQTASFKIKKEATATELEPANGARFTEKDTIVFRWQSSDNKAPMTFRLAKDPHFNQPVLERNTSKNQLLIDPLAEGQYWWRLESPSGKSSSTQSFKVNKTETKPEETTTTTEEIKEIKKEETTLTTKLQEINKPNLNNKEKQLSLKQSDIDDKKKKLENQEQLIALKEAQQRKEQQTILKELARFRLISPTEGSNVKEKTITFSWEKLNLPVRYHYQLAKEADMQQPILSQTTEENSITIDSPKTTGTWYWQVDVLDARTNKLLSKGDIYYFKILPATKPKPPRITEVKVE